MKKILIIGATSAIAEHCARLWAARKDELFLVGRDGERLGVMAADLKVRGATAAHVHGADLSHLGAHPFILDAAEAQMGGVDVVLIAHGVLPDQTRCEANLEEMLDSVHINAISTLSLLTLIANRFEERKAGTIAVISSVAGDRGRASNYVYGSSKAMVTAFTSGLRQRLHKSSVAVVTIKPGLVDTPMAASFKKGLLWAKPDDVAQKMVTAIDRRQAEVYVPSFWWAVMMVIKLMPHSIFIRLSKI
ncbi:MAG: SDR family oxidoreductase [Alphaproteobacteria bacterium]|nr:SDR family oxidoreductase [Alphaproteobacteria bacterium]